MPGYPISSWLLKHRTTVSTVHAHVGAGSTISRRVNVVSIVSEERHGSVMEKSSDGVLFVQPSLTITEKFLGSCKLETPPVTCITTPPKKPKAGVPVQGRHAGKQGNIRTKVIYYLA